MADDPVEVVRRFIDAFIDAWPSRSSAGLVSFFSHDAVYHNTPLEPVRGRRAIGEALDAFMAIGGAVSVDIRNVVGNGRVVMVERVDHLASPERRLSVPMAGVFEVEDGRILAWRDYFDLGQAI